MLPYDCTPSFLAISNSAAFTPISDRLSRSVFSVSSPLIAVHELPRSVDLKTLLAPT